MKKLVLTVTADLPDDEFDRAGILANMRVPLFTFLEAAVKCGAPAATDVQIVTARPKRGRPRKQKDQALPGVAAQ